ncbi:MAG: hypothetical protein D3926_12120 [Desulfobacteraceae bacterium]|nr:MAG: hypothetical protein D3926_12120 [Desulfobacteraceae bacterium]
MDNSILKINILAIAISGLLMLLSGVLLYLFKHLLSGDVLRYFLPIPPIGVAAYIFVFNMFKTYNAALPDKSVTLVSEVLISSLISGLIFFVFVVLLIAVISLFLK